MRFRALLPSWRFFDRATAIPRLFLRALDGSWVPLGAAPRRWWSWAFAPTGNLTLAYHGLVEQLVAAVDALEGDPPDDDPRITGLVEYGLVENLAGGRAWKVMVTDGTGTEVDYLVVTRS